MLAKLEPAHNDFHALASYLIHGRERPTHPDRVAWAFGHNLPTDDATIAAHYMAFTAELSRRCQAACLHMSINWHPNETPTPEIMQEIARKTLDLAGLGEHQTFIMGHGDKAHRHLHMMINRVHPETGRAWDMYRSHQRFDRIMKELAGAHGFAHVPCHAFDPEATYDTRKVRRSKHQVAALTYQRSSDRPAFCAAGILQNPMTTEAERNNVLPMQGCPIEAVDAVVYGREENIRWNSHDGSNKESGS